ncbi:microcystin degradation protein MlrC [Stella humosa]|uniref:Microcystinase C n=1 Tax=Stella humosa TaxID=94 RepID=A0A3N1M997_9PROT|nr:M81 family metallopeptidase [Stella humosa]ROQ00238.1 microcystin degradation protein MlrC [Stella humosa]BBK30526.1 microcystinase C [Stella humosa]
MRCFTASLGAETNTFSPMLTSRDGYRERLHVGPGEHPERPTLYAAPLWVARQRAKTKGWDVVEGSCFAANPAGNTVRRDYEAMRDEILAELRAAMPVDIVLMGLHGAMVADGYDDCEGDLLSRIREIVGPKVPVGVELDPHCHLTRQRVAASDVIICYKEFPHTDTVARAEELADIIEAQALGQVKPVMSVFDMRMLNGFPTSRQPMRGFVDKIMSMEGKDGILSISVAHGFGYGDVPEVGAKMLVVTDDRKEFGDALAEKLGRELWDLRDELRPPALSIDEALDRGTARNQGTVVVADGADNAGGGAGGDSTFILRRMMERGITEAALGPIWDPVAVRMCFNAGEGTSFQLRFGGKVAVTSGQPIDARVTVLKLVRGMTQTFAGELRSVGDAAAIDVDGIAVVLISTRLQALGTDLFTNLGIDLAQRRIVVVKSTNHFFAAFGPIAEEVLYTSAPGPLPRDLRTLPYKKLPRPIWPFDENPWK